GYIAEKTEFLTSIYTTVAFCNEKIDIYLATGLKRREGQDLDEDEFVDVYAYDLEELISMIYENKIQDSKTICGIMLYAYKYKK
ncbi:MAG: NUDIX hydrolase, partial [Lachnospiraceae bacterium]|nr:NUDIX hydrolase [Lachnospiraceae bacterium]